MAIYTIQFAGVILLCITTANFFAPKKMRWTGNLEKTEPVFRQVFILHCVFLLACIVAMAFLCLFKPHWLLEDGLGKAIAAFMALFLGGGYWLSSFTMKKASSVSSHFLIYYSLLLFSI